MATSGSHVTQNFSFMEVYSLGYGDLVINQVLWSISMYSLSLANRGGGKLIPEVELILLQKTQSQLKTLIEFVGEWSVERRIVCPSLPSPYREFLCKKMEMQQKDHRLWSLLNLARLESKLCWFTWINYLVSWSLGILSGKMGA